MNKKEEKIKPHVNIGTLGHKDRSKEEIIKAARAALKDKKTKDDDGER